MIRNKEQFSKKILARTIVDQIKFANIALKIDTGEYWNPADGYQQVLGNGESANRYYGAIKALETLYTNLELDSTKTVWDIEETLRDTVERG